MTPQEAKGNKEENKKTYNTKSIQLAQYELPLFKEKKKSRAQKWIDFGDDNLFPLKLVDLFNQSAVHNAIVTGKVNYIVGRGLTVRKDPNARGAKGVKSFVRRPNTNENLQDIFKNLAMDYEMHNGFCIKVVRAKTNDNIVEVHHQDWTTVRRADDRSSVLISDNWETQNSKANYRLRNSRPDTKEYPLYDPEGTDKVSFIYFMEYRPDIRYYPYPEYVGALPQIETTTEIAKYDLNSIINGFAGGTIINLLNGLPATEEEAKAIERDVIEKLTGSENANRVLLNFAEDKDHSSFIDQINGNDLADRFSDLEQRVMQNVFIGHKIISPMLFGVRSEGQLGGRREILEAYELFKETYILRRQDALVGTLNGILEDMGYPRLLMVEELKPINPRLPLSDEEVMRLVPDESKLEYIQTTYGVKTIETEAARENASLSVQFSEDENKESVIRYLSYTGESESDYRVLHTYDIDVSSNEPIFGLNDVSEFKLDEDNEQRGRILKVIEENPEVTADELAKTFDTSLSDMAIQLGVLIGLGYVIRNGASNEVTESGRDIVNTLPENLGSIRIMYRYETAPDAPPLKTRSRDFCHNLVGMKKLFTREQIEGMSNHMSPSSIVPDINDVWKYRGGWYRRAGSDVSVPMCRHTWKQVLVRKRNGK